MCKSAIHTDHSQLPEKKYRLADYFDSWWDEYCKSPRHFITPEQYKAANAIRICRTAYLGVDTYACRECGEITEIYHSCKNRFCPTCSWRDTLEWAERIKKNMLDVPHRHVVITLPHGLNTLIKKNGKHLLNVLLRTAADTLKDWIKNKYRIKIGVIEVLHTFGEMKQYHPHVHMIVSWGGIDIKTGELRKIESEFVNYAFLQKKFRCKYEDALVELYESGQLRHNFRDYSSLKRFIKNMNKDKWVLHFEPPMEIPEQVVRYIGRYSKRACLSEYKITNIEGENITFRYKDNKDKDQDNKPIEKELELNYRDFFPLLLQHVPLKYFRLVRYYGLYSNKGNTPEEYLAKEQVIEVSEEDSIRKTDSLECDTCNIPKEYVYTIFKTRNKIEIYIINRLKDKRRKIPDLQVA